MFTLRQKIFFGYLAVFLIFLVLMFPFAAKTVDRIVLKTMEDNTAELITKLKSARNNDALISKLKQEKAFLFFRVSIITNEKKLLYDSHTKRLLGGRFSQEYVVDHPEVLEAFQEGKGTYEDWSELLKQRFVYLARTFDFHGKTYVIRAAFPSNYVTELTRNFEIGFLGLGSVILLLFSILTWFIINHLTSPIQQIIEAVRPYREGGEAALPEIKLSRASSTDDFGKLASTLNSLSARIQRHIDTLTREKNEKAAILESLGEGVLAIDGTFQIAYANNMAKNLLGIKEPFHGETFSEEYQKKCYQVLMQCIEQQKIQTETLELKASNGEKIFLDLIAAPLQPKSGAILVLQDKSPHYKILEMRKNFIANASHELKTPITIVRGFAETLHENENLPRETVGEITEKIVRNCLRMSNLVKDLLTLTDIEHIPESRLEQFNLTDMIDNCAMMVSDAFPDATIKVDKRTQEEIHYIGDPHLLEMAFMNLIENAAKYSEEPAEISIAIQSNKDWISIRIEDQGIGIPKDDLERIFQRFYTVNKAHSKKMGGSGLGLSIVQTIVEKHFGKIEVASEIGKGTAFTILLPKEMRT